MVEPEAETSLGESASPEAGKKARLILAQSVDWSDPAERERIANEIAEWAHAENADQFKR